MYDHVYTTGDIHGDLAEIIYMAQRVGLTKKDLLIILGDVGGNTDNGRHDLYFRECSKLIPCPIFCIHGNHERRPTSPDIKWNYKEMLWNNGVVYIEDEYPNLIFAKDGERYNINNREYLVIGGAYSVDKEIRLLRGWLWCEDEQLSDKEKNVILKDVIAHGKHEDIILAHTCPYDYRPIDQFLPGVNQSKVDNGMEIFLQTILDTIGNNYNAFYCGHWHIDRRVNKVHFLMHSWELIE